MKKYILSLLTLMVIPISIVSAQSADAPESRKEVNQVELKTSDLQDYQMKENYKVVYDEEFLTVGVDIPAGNYRVVSDKVGYVFGLDSEQNTTDSLFVINWSYIELIDNQTIKLKEVFLTPVTDEMTPATNGEDVIADGIYLIGTDIDSGTYNILSTEMESTIAIFDTFDVTDFNNATYPRLSESNFTVEEGQILSIGKVEISK